MTQTNEPKLFGLTFREALNQAIAQGACETAVTRLTAMGSWERVLGSDRLAVCAEWFLDSLRPTLGCECIICTQRAAKLTPEREALAEKLEAIMKEWRMLDESGVCSRDFLEAKLREHLTND